VALFIIEYLSNKQIHIIVLSK